MCSTRGSRQHGLFPKVLLAAAILLGASAWTSASASAAPTGCQALRSSLARLACFSNAASTSGQRKNVPPAGARAVCRDGTYSFSETRWVACRFHGGVGRWLG